VPHIGPLCSRSRRCMPQDRSSRGLSCTSRRVGSQPASQSIEALAPGASKSMRQEGIEPPTYGLEGRSSYFGRLRQHNVFSSPISMKPWTCASGRPLVFTPFHWRTGTRTGSGLGPTESSDDHAASWRMVSAGMNPPGIGTHDQAQRAPRPVAQIVSDPSVRSLALATQSG